MNHNTKKNMSLDRLQNEIESFRKERNWDQSDTPYILAKSVFVEASELLECFMNGADKVDETAVKYEVADVLMYALSLCYDAGWDPGEVILEKMDDVALRYPKVTK